MSDEVFEYKDQLAYVPESRILEILKENRDTIGSIRFKGIEVSIKKSSDPTPGQFWLLFSETKNINGTRHESIYGKTVSFLDTKELDIFFTDSVVPINRENVLDHTGNVVSFEHFFNAFFPKESKMEQTPSSSFNNPMLFPGFKLEIIPESISTVKGHGITNLNFILHHVDKPDFIYHGTVYLDATEYDDQGRESTNYKAAYSGLCLSGYSLANEHTRLDEDYALEFNDKVYYSCGENLEPLIECKIEWKTHGDVSALQTYETDFRPKVFSNLQESLYSAQKNILHRDYYVTTKTGADYMAGVLMMAAGYHPF